MYLCPCSNGCLASPAEAIHFENRLINVDSSVIDLCSKVSKCCEAVAGGLMSFRRFPSSDC
jgi:hypothetical protein